MVTARGRTAGCDLLQHSSISAQTLFGHICEVRTARTFGRSENSIPRCPRKLGWSFKIPTIPEAPVPDRACPSSFPGRAAMWHLGVLTRPRNPRGVHYSSCYDSCIGSHYRRLSIVAHLRAAIFCMRQTYSGNCFGTITTQLPLLRLLSMTTTASFMRTPFIAQRITRGVSIWSYPSARPLANADAPLTYWKFVESVANDVAALYLGSSNCIDHGYRMQLPFTI